MAETTTTRASHLDELMTLVDYCAASRNKRRATALLLRQWFEYGSPGPPAVYNKLAAHLDRLMSFLWSPDAIRFAVHLPPANRTMWLKAASTARDEFRQSWALAGADLAVSLALEWSLVYGAEVLKVQHDPGQGFVVSAIEPWDFGVSREDVPSLDDQDVMTHWYSFSVPQFERWVQEHPRASDLIAMAKEHATVMTAPSSSTTLLVTGATGGFPNTNWSTAMQGELDPGLDATDPEVREPVLELCDVWRRRLHREAGKSFEDWEVTTLLASAQQIVAQRRNPILPWMVNPAGGPPLPGEHPFTVLVPRPRPNYLWGSSVLSKLLGLQTWREEHVQNMRDIIRRQLDPAKFFAGVPDPEEVGRALSTPGGSAGTPDGSGRMDLIRPEVGQEAFGMIQQIDNMYADQSGIPPVLEGNQPPGTRANSQLMSLAGVGAGRIRNMALNLETALSRVATQAFRVLQRHDDTTYTSPDGEMQFLLGQLPAAISLSVSSHSASPVFEEQTQAKALALLKAGALNGEWLVELLDPPHRDELKQVARELAMARAQQEEKFMEVELEKVRRRRGKIP